MAGPNSFYHGGAKPSYADEFASQYKISDEMRKYMLEWKRSHAYAADQLDKIAKEKGFSGELDPYGRFNIIGEGMPEPERLKLEREAKNETKFNLVQPTSEDVRIAMEAMPDNTDIDSAQRAILGHIHGRYGTGEIPQQPSIVQEQQKRQSPVKQVATEQQWLKPKEDVPESLYGGQELFNRPSNSLQNLTPENEPWVKTVNDVAQEPSMQQQPATVVPEQKPTDQPVSKGDPFKDNVDIKLKQASANVTAKPTIIAETIKQTPYYGETTMQLEDIATRARIDDAQRLASGISGRSPYWDEYNTRKSEIESYNTATRSDQYSSKIEQGGVEIKQTPAEVQFKHTPEKKVVRGGGGGGGSSRKNNADTMHLKSKHGNTFPVSVVTDNRGQIKVTSTENLGRLAKWEDYISAGKNSGDNAYGKSYHDTAVYDYAFREYGISQNSITSKQSEQNGLVRIIYTINDGSDYPPKIHCIVGQEQPIAVTNIPTTTLENMGIDYIHGGKVTDPYTKEVIKDEFRDENNYQNTDEIHEEEIQGSGVWR